MIKHERNYNELSDDMKNYNISDRFTKSKINNTIQYTIKNMKMDNYLYKKVCPTPVMKRIKTTYMHTACYGSDESDSELLEKESER